MKFFVDTANIDDIRDLASQAYWMASQPTVTGCQNRQGFHSPDRGNL